MRLINADDLIERINVVIEHGLADPDGLHPLSAEVVLDTINVIPTATPEPHWIPVTDHTHTEEDDYWCTFDAESGIFVDWCSWYQGHWVTWLEGSPLPTSNVVAWCKPMEPFKGVTE